MIDISGRVLRKYVHGIFRIPCAMFAHLEFIALYSECFPNLLTLYRNNNWKKSSDFDFVSRSY